MASYVRQSTFVDGDLITASLFNNEYNKLVDAFDNATGHKHDGTIGEGPVIGLIGDAGVVTPLNKILVDTTNDYIEFWIDVSGTSTQQFYIADGAIVPVTDNDIDLGTSSLQFKDLYINGTANIDSLVADTADINGGTIDGVTIGGSSAGAITGTTITGTSFVIGNASINETELEILDGATLTTTELNYVDGVTSSIQTQLNTKAPLSSPSLTGIPTAPTASANTNTTQVATTAYVQTEITDLIGAAPGTLDTLNELAAAINDDANYNTTLTTALATKLPLAGGTMTGDVTYSDNVKAQFGTSQDLQIYHDGSNSYIRDTGTGTLRIQGSSSILMQKLDGEIMMIAREDGAVELNHNGSQKISTTSSGIDVTGTVTSDGLVVNGEINGPPTNNLTIRSKYSATIDIDSDNNQTDRNFQVIHDGSKLLLKAEESGDISFYEDTGTTAKLFWDASAERLGLGTSSPKSLLNVTGTGSDGGILTLENDSTSLVTDRKVGQIHFYSNDGSANGAGVKADIKAIAENSIGSEIGLAFGTSDTSSATAVEAMRISADGSVGIGTDSPSSKLTVTGDIEQTTGDLKYTGGINWDIAHHGASQNIVFSTTPSGGSATEVMRIKHDGSVGIGTASPSEKLHVVGGAATVKIESSTNEASLKYDNSTTTGAIKLANNDLKTELGGSEVMRILANGNIGIGTSSPANLLSIESTGQFAGMNIKSASSNGISYIDFGDADDNNIGGINYDNSTDTLQFRNGNANHVFLKSDGKVGIGTTSPSEKLTLRSTQFDTTHISIGDSVERLRIGYLHAGGLASSTSASQIGSDSSSDLSIAAPSNDASEIKFFTNTASGTPSEALRIDSSQRVGIGTTSIGKTLTVGGSGLRVQSTASADFYSTGQDALVVNNGTANLRFWNNGSERMRLDASGNFLVGKTISSSATAGITLEPAGAVVATRDGGECFIANRKTSSGTIIQLRKDQATVGSLGIQSSGFYIDGEASHTGLRFTSAGITPRLNGAESDNTVDLGESGIRFKDLHLSGTANADSGFQVGSIGNIGNVANDVVVFSSSAGHNGLRFHANGILPTDNTGAIIDADADIGISTYRFKDLHLSGTANFGSLSDGTITITGFADEDNMSSNSATLVPTQQSVKAYVDSQVSSAGGNGISFEDNEKAQFGDGNDLQIFHNGTESRIEDSGTGNLVIKATNLELKSYGTNEAYLTANQNGAVNLFYDNAAKLATTSSGVQITGTLDVDVISNASGVVHLNDTLYFQDNSKAIFGDSSDLEIYHDGSNSVIKDAGTGNLRILGSSWTIIEGATSGTWGIAHLDGAQTNLYHNGNLKLATTSTGIDVTGTVTSDGLTVSDGTNGIIQVGALNTRKIAGGADYGGIRYYSDNDHILYTNNIQRLAINSGGDISFYDDTGSTQGLFWDASAESLGIGTTSPTAPLHITQESNAISGTNVDVSNLGLKIINPQNDNNEAVGMGFALSTASSNIGAAIIHQRDDVQSRGSLSFATKPALGEGADIPIRMTISSDGDVGIGTSSPSETLTVVGDASISTTGNSTGLRIITSATGEGYLIFGDTADNSMGGMAYSNSTNALMFDSNNAERMRIDSSGNLLVGTTSAANSSAGFRAYSGGNGAFTIAGTALSLNRLSSDGEILNFQKDTSTVGSIGYSSGNFRLDGDGLGLHLNGSVNVIYPSNGSGSLNNGVVDLGLSSSRFKDLHLSGTANVGGLKLGDNEFILAGTGSDLKIGHDGTDNIIRSQGSSLYINANNHIFTGYSPYTEHMRINSSGNVGIGTSSPISKFQVNSSTFPQVRINETTGGGESGIRFRSTNGVNVDFHADIFIDGTGSEAGRMGFRVPYNSSEKMTILSSGYVGIGTDSPARKLEVNAGSASMVAQFKSTLTSSFVCFANSSSTADQVRIGSNGTALTLSTNYTERARIDSSGNLLVGKTSSSTGVAGARFSANGFSNVTRDGGECFNLNRLTSDGTIIDFRKDSTTVGSIGTAGGQLNIGANTTSGLQFATNLIYPRGTGNTTQDGTIDLGNSGNRFKDLYLSGTANIDKALIGTSSAGATDAKLTLENGFSDCSIYIGAGGDYNYIRSIRNANNDHDLAIGKNYSGSSDSEHLRITNEGNVGIGTSSPASKLSTVGTIRAEGMSTITGGGKGTEIRYDTSNDYGGILSYDRGTSTYKELRVEGSIIKFKQSGTDVMTIDGGNVGIGTSSPSYKLNVAGDIVADGDGNTRTIGFDFYGALKYNLHMDGSTDADKMHIRKGTTNVATFDTSGKVGIGTTSPATNLTVEGSGANGIELNRNGADASQSARLFFDSSTSGYALMNVAGSLTFNSGSTAGASSGTERMRIDSSGRLNMMSSAGASPILYHGNDLTSTSPTTNLSFGNEQNGALLIYTNSSERMRIDASGNLLVGKTSASSASIGFQAGQDGFTAITRASAQPLVLNRTTNDGIIAEFKRDSTQVGNIGCPDGANGSQLVIAAGVGGTNTGVGLRFTSFTVKTILPCYDDGSNHDDEIDLGTSSARFDDIYATNGTIQTSDRNDKQDIEEITDAETRVAVACKGLIRKFRWKSAVAEKDDNSDSDETARIHFGIIAQDLQDAFTAEGLDAGDYAMFTSQTWEDSDGVEQTRLGVRYSELLAFIIAAI